VTLIAIRRRQIAVTIVIGFVFQVTTRTRRRTDKLVVINGAYRRPQRSGMACLASISRRQVSCRFAGGNGAIVTTDAIGGDTGVTKSRGRPRRGRVTRAAICRGCNVIGRLAGSSHAVVTTRTRTRHLRVIDACRWRPSQRAVTIHAIVGGGDMRRRFARRRGAVVATETRGGDTTVIEMRRRPRGSGMT
jgi:hypothetical protein